MTYEEAIERLSNRYFTVSMCIDANAAIKENMAIDMAIEALDKQMPKKPHLEGDGYWACPNCEEKYEYYNELDCLKWCSACGQAIDWSEVAE